MTHQIRQQFLHVEFTGSEAAGFALQNLLSGMCRTTLLLPIEEALDRCASPEGAYLRIDNIEIEVGNVDLTSLENSLGAMVAQALETQIRARFPSGTEMIEEESPPSDSDLKYNALALAGEIFLHFLRTGRLTWNFRLPAGVSLETHLLATLSDAHPQQAKFNEIKAILVESPLARQRLVWQFSPGFLQWLLERTEPNILAFVRSITGKLRGLGISDQAYKIIETELWKAAFAQAKQDQTDREFRMVVEITQALNKSSASEAAAAWQIRAAPLWPKLHGISEVVSAKSQELNTNEEKNADSADRMAILEDGIYLENAGLVLLNPFLPLFFQNLGIAKNNKLEKPERALLLLHYLATGLPEAGEHELVLPKILCGIAPETPVDVRIELDDAEKTEAQALLEAVIRHWEALRSTSPDGLRGNFLYREGMLSLREVNHWTLRVEHKSYDILLDQLPWTIGMIRLPWMDSILYVEWN